MKVVISSGHGLYVRGASGFLDEVNEAREIVEAVADDLRELGVDVVTYHDDVSRSQDENLQRLVDFHNAQGAHELDVSVHLNAYQTTEEPMGVEVLYVSQLELAGKVSAAIARAGGLIDRGPKERNDLFWLNNTEAPAILIETLFCDSQADAELYDDNFEAITVAIAETIAGRDADEEPDRPGRPDRPERPEDVPIEERPTLVRGDSGFDVEDLQMMLPRFEGLIDGDFGPVTEEAVIDYQRSRGLEADGIVGEQTWTALYERRRPIAPSPPPPGAFNEREQRAIIDIADGSEIGSYYWEDRGLAPIGYTRGMALAFGQTYRKLLVEHPAALEMARARTDSDKDALNIYRTAFHALGMSNEDDGANTLRHLYALMIGHGMRESSGKHCEGRDMSADNVQSDTAEAGLFQTSYNAHSASSPEFDDLMDEYSLEGNAATCYLDVFEDGVSCSDDDWSSYGSGSGHQFQVMCKECPAFACETAALTLRNLANHYGPIIRGEVELRREADVMLREVQAYVDGLEATA